MISTRELYFQVPSSSLFLRHLYGTTLITLSKILTGKGTSYRVNGLAVQAKVYGPHLPRADLPYSEKKKKISISTKHQELKVYVAGTHVGPQPLRTREDHEAEEEVMIACKKNLV